MDINPQNSPDEDLKPGKDLKSYIENRIELFSISIAEQIASAVSASVHKFVGLLFLGIGGIFLWIALGFFLGELLNSNALGFLLASIPPLFIGLIVYNRSSRSLDEKIQTDIIKKVDLQIRSTITSSDTDLSKKIKNSEPLTIKPKIKHSE